MQVSQELSEQRLQEYSAEVQRKANLPRHGQLLAMTEHLQTETAEQCQLIIDKDNENAALLDNLRFLEVKMSNMHEQGIAEIQRQCKKHRQHHPEQYLELRAAYDELSEEQAHALASGAIAAA